MCQASKAPRDHIQPSEAHQWVQCDSCDEWLHLTCSGLLKKDLVNTESLKCLVCCVLKSCGRSSEAIVLSIRLAIKNQTLAKSTKRTTKNSQKSSSCSNVGVPSSERNTPAGPSEVYKDQVQSESQEDQVLSAATDHSYSENSRIRQIPSGPVRVGVPISNLRDSIIIVDSIDAQKFKCSRDILKEIKLLAPDIDVESAFLLSRGG